MTRFDDLVTDIRDILGPSSGLDSEEIEVEDLKDVMRKYQSEMAEWSKFAMEDPSRAYTRNLVDEGNGKANLLILVWTPHQGSPIHDHGNAHCVMKILHGSLTETRYAFPDGDDKKPMEQTLQTVYNTNEVAYMSDDLGTHRMANDGDDFAVSLHLYTPPNVAKHGCNIFDRRTGKKSHVPKCGYYSRFGQREGEAKE